jgi:hypothetical protein
MSECRRAVPAPHRLLRQECGGQRRGPVGFVDNALVTKKKNKKNKKKSREPRARQRHAAKPSREVTSTPAPSETAPSDAVDNTSPAPSGAAHPLTVPTDTYPVSGTGVRVDTILPRAVSLSATATRPESLEETAKGWPNIG